MPQEHTSSVFILHLTRDRVGVAGRELCSKRLAMPAATKATCYIGTFEGSLTWYEGSLSHEMLNNSH